MILGSRKEDSEEDYLNQFSVKVRFTREIRRRFKDSRFDRMLVKILFEVRRLYRRSHYLVTLRICSLKLEKDTIVLFYMYDVWYLSSFETFSILYSSSVGPLRVSYAQLNVRYRRGW